MKINKNMGGWDRLIRLIAGIALIIGGVIAAPATKGWIMIVFGVPLLTSAFFGFCPTYTLLGISSKRENDCC